MFLKIYFIFILNILYIYISSGMNSFIQSQRLIGCHTDSFSGNISITSIKKKNENKLYI